MSEININLGGEYADATTGFDKIETIEKVIDKRPNYEHKIIMRRIIRNGKVIKEVDLQTTISMEPKTADKFFKGVEDAKRRNGGMRNE